jgi:glyoxylase-like metal-dependent hydrolase (beta-lactamase superfamily II)
VKRVIVTHAHTDHFGGAVWLQQESGCDVLMHPADTAVATSTWRSDLRELFGPLGYTAELLDRYFSGEWKFETPEFSPLIGGDVFEVGTTRLRIEHRPGHTPGHIWVTDETSKAMFVGDYLIADHPTNAGLEIDRTDPTGRAPLLQQYTEGLRELASRPAPALFAAHGPPITDHRALIERRLQKSDRRTARVLKALSDMPTSAFDLGTRLYRGRAAGSWEVMADLTGRLDLLVAQGRASAHLGEDGVWYFHANDL